MEICIGWDILQLGLPILEIIFGIIENLTGLVDVVVGWSNVSRNNWCIIEEVEESAAMTSKDNLLFGAFNSCSEFSSVCLLQLLACLFLVSVIGSGYKDSDVRYWSVVLQQPNSLPLLEPAPAPI